MDIKKNKSLSWLFFDLNSFFASVEQQDKPHLRGRPVAVVPADTDTTCAIAASYEAKAYGIKTGTRIYDAKKMCPELICVLADHSLYTRYHSAIMASVENYIHIEKICSIDEAACKLPKQFQAPNAATDLALQIKRGLANDIGAHIKCSIGLAGNHYLAKIATELQKPDGLVIIHPDREPEQLFKLKLRDLTGIGPSMEARLIKAGIHSIKDLWNISPKHARQIWNNVGGERFWYKLHGYEIDDIQTKTSMIGHSRILDPEHRTSDKARSIARTLTLKAAQRLRKTGLYAKRFHLSIRDANFFRWGKEISFSPAHDDFTALHRFNQLWQEMIADFQQRGLNPKIKKVSVSLYDFFQAEQITLDLFDFAQSQAQESSPIKTQKQNDKLTSAIDAINKRFGKDKLRIGGVCPVTKAGNIGTKIAFTRVPDEDEF